MRAVLDVDTCAVTETQWERLYRIAEARRIKLDLTLAGVQAVGGPSPKWVQRLRMMDGEPGPRMRASMLDLDRALQWPDGTSWSLVAEDRSGWSEDVLADEEESLLERKDEASDFGFVIAARLRALPQPQRDEAMRRILDLLDIRG